MKTLKYLLLSITLLLSQSILAHDAHYEITAQHNWTLIDGTQFQGSFYLTKGESVMIETNDGKVETISMSRLCKSDQKFVSEKIAWIKKINAMQNMWTRTLLGRRANG